MIKCKCKEDLGFPSKDRLFQPLAKRTDKNVFPPEANGSFRLVKGAEYLVDERAYKSYEEHYKKKGKPNPLEKSNGKVSSNKTNKV